ncbi:MAG: phage terminase large subunit [Dehalococcoidales bacterium]|nr:phage terminase large subunit [Dehalococcoidales bacterium]
MLLSGPAGTGKSRACLEKLHLCALKYPGMRGLMVRKTRASLTESAMVTMNEKVLHELDHVDFHTTTQEYRYPNGSRIVVGGLDKATKVMSSEYDIIYVQEATELSEHDWESLTTRLRNGVMPYQQLLGDCNPDAPHHWLKKRADSGKTVMLESRHEDNPTLWDRVKQTWTELGARYIAKLEALTGVRYLRLRKGIWAAAEGMVYDGWDRDVHLIDRFEIPADWRRYLSVDFGYTNPFVAQWWAEDGDGRLYRYREIYRVQQLVEDHAAEMKRLMANERMPEAVICDHDAEDRATLERHLGLSTIAAHKAVSPGIQAVASRLKRAGDGKSRLFLLRDSLVDRDPLLEEAKKPTCTEEEIEGYVWNDKVKRDEPVKANDHGMDPMRYVVAHIDLVGRVTSAPSIW